MRGAQAFQPVAAARKFGRQRDIGNIAGDRDVVGCLRLDVGDDRRERRRIVNEAALALPVDVAGHALADQLAPARRRQRREMRVGKMREGEHRCRD